MRGSLRGLIHPAVGFPARIKACYVTPLEQVRACFCARSEIRSQLTVACVHTRSSEQLVDHSAQPVGQNARHLVRTETSGRAETRAVAFRQNAQSLDAPEGYERTYSVAERGGAERPAACDLDPWKQIGQNISAAGNKRRGAFGAQRRSYEQTTVAPLITDTAGEFQFCPL